MSDTFIANTQTIIKADISAVWTAVTNPYRAKLRYSVEQFEPWAVGSALSFKGYWQEGEYEDKGVIVELIDHKLFSYAFWSRFSGHLDLPENYDTITFEFKDTASGTQLTITQNNYPSQSAAETGTQNWTEVLVSIQQMLEK